MGFDFVNGIAPYAVHETGVQETASYAVSSTSASYAYLSDIAAEAASADVAHSVFVETSGGAVLIMSGALNLVSASVKTNGVTAISLTTIFLSGSMGGAPTSSQLTFRNGLLISSSIWHA